MERLLGVGYAATAAALEWCRPTLGGEDVGGGGWWWYAGGSRLR